MWKTMLYSSKKLKTIKWILYHISVRKKSQMSNRGTVISAGKGSKLSSSQPDRAMRRIATPRII